LRRIEPAGDTAEANHSSPKEKGEGRKYISREAKTSWQGGGECSGGKQENGSKVSKSNPKNWLPEKTEEKGREKKKEARKCAGEGMVRGKK